MGRVKGQGGGPMYLCPFCRRHHEANSRIGKLHRQRNEHKQEVVPWDGHAHRPSPAPDEAGDTLCEDCGLVLSGPSADEAAEIQTDVDKEVPDAK